MSFEWVRTNVRTNVGFGWKKVFEAAETGTPDTYKDMSKGAKAFGVGVHALQDSKAHKGVKMKDHDLNKDMGRTEEGIQAWGQASSITESALVVVEILNNNFSNVQDGKVLDFSGMNKDQLKQVLDAALKADKNIRFVNEN